MHFMVVIICGLIVITGATKDNEPKDKKVTKSTYIVNEEIGDCPIIAL